MSSEETFLRSIPRRLSILINMIGTLIMVYFAYRTVGTVLAVLPANSVFIQRVQLNFIWGSYDPVIGSTLESIAVFFIFYKKFYPKNIYLFAFIWGISDVAFNLIYDIYHLPQLIAAPEYWQIGAGWMSYFKIMGIEGAIGVIGLILLRPKFDWSFSWVKYGSLAILITGYVYSFLTGFQVTTNPLYGGDMNLYTLAFIENAALLIFVYTTTTIRKAKSA